MPFIHGFVSFIFLSCAFSAVVAYSNATSDCGQLMFTDNRGGTIKFRRSSTPSKSCTYFIKVDSGQRIVLKWKRFSVDGEMPFCSSSSVAVYIGCYSHKISDFCSRNTDSLPHDIYSVDNCMKIVFSSRQAANEEFLATYETHYANDPVSSSSFCKSNTYLYSKSGVVISPQWPKKTSVLSYECDWEIKVPTKYVIKLNFMDVDLYRSSRSYHCSRSSNRLRLKGEKSLFTSYKRKEYYCRKRNPFSKTTRYYEIELEYKVGYHSSPTRGFAVGYIAYRTDETVKAASNHSTYTYIGLGSALVVLVLCCIFFAWRRRKRAREAAGVVYHPQPSQEARTVITTYQKGPDYGTGPPVAPPSYNAAMAQPPYQGFSQPPYPQGAQYPTNAAPYPTSGAPYPPTSASSEPYPGAAPYPGATAAPPYPTSQASYSPAGAQAPYPSAGAQAPYPSAGAQAPYPSAGAQAPYPPADGQAPYPTK